MNSPQRASGFIQIIAIASILILIGGLGAKFLKNMREKASLQSTTGQVGGDISTPISSTGTTTASSYQISRPGDYERSVPGWNNRSYLIHAPAGYDGTKPLPVIIAIHGGGGNATAQVRLTCPNGDLNSSKCLNKLSDRENFIVVYPNGTLNPILKNSRTFNAGGGINGYACVSNPACPKKIDDIAYFNALLDDLVKTANINQGQVYATGISNGGAMSHRLACQLANRITAIAAVGGANQYSAVASCNPSRAVPLLQIHGTTDPAWPYVGGVLAGGKLFDDGNVISVDATISGWVSRNGCSTSPTTETLAQTTNDGTSVTKVQYGGCRNSARVMLYRITNGGHTWPQGYPYLSTSIVGKVSQQFNANEVIWNFLKQFSK